MDVLGLQLAGCGDNTQQFIHTGGLEDLIHPLMHIDDLQLVGIVQTLLQNQELTHTGSGHVFHVGEVEQHIAIGVEIILTDGRMQDVAGSCIDAALNMEGDLTGFFILFNGNFHNRFLSSID
ncbi:MAG: hypothetical protein J6K94_01325 [Ruminiclostridium sp.]|nr:hypothetical protein [Ruminiclostridium sp.]